MTAIDTNYSYLTNAELPFFDQLYTQYKQSPESVDKEWQKFFEGFELGSGRVLSSTEEVPEQIRKEIYVLNLIKGYRTRGHLFTDTNPVRDRRKYTPTLAIENFGLQEQDLDQTFNAGIEIGIGKSTLRAIIQHLEETYCRSIGAEFVYIRVPERVEWLQQKMESSKNMPSFSIEEKRHLLSKLNQAQVFENFLHTKFVGQKRFSLEGLETLIPALDEVIQYGAELGVKEFVVGMAHRGRLNVLANILGKSYNDIFKEFEGKTTEDDGIFEGDVKYHLGFSADITTRHGKEVHLALSPNPSHLETVNPVVKGLTRAKIDTKYNGDGDKVAPILIHGDASVAGQGVVYEVLQMAGLKAYNVGGCIHIVANNQIGFTTNYIDARSSTYCTDVAKVTLCPVFHVNADDVEAVVFTVKLAMEYRQKFNSDVFIDLLGYRKYGHNEGDEPRFTQPLLYKAIAAHPNPREIYHSQLLAKGSVDADLAREMDASFRKQLQEKLESAKLQEPPLSQNFVAKRWQKYRAAKSEDFDQSPETFVTKEVLEHCANEITKIPSDFKAFNKIEKLFAERKNQNAKGIYDWAMGELLAYATLAKEGHSIRMSGQDCERGTFSHRHAIIQQEESESGYNIFSQLTDKSVKFYNSFLSEYAVLGFEYGYSMYTPNDLTIWEAQFGDFANGAQIIIDQYIASAEAKWRTYSGLTMMLPHGYEGQGPEHSSARIERFLQLAAKNNIQVVQCTNPANYFHVLRRQLKREFRLPLVLFTPKSLLRHPLCVSEQKEFTSGTFKEVIVDPLYNDKKTAKKVRKVLLCSGKIYYDLIEYREKNQIKDVAIIRLEQLYPFPEKQMKQVYDSFENASYYWVQEEPRNMGAWMFLKRWEMNDILKCISRDDAASPATGFSKVHASEQESILQEAFN